GTRIGALTKKIRLIYSEGRNGNLKNQIFTKTSLLSLLPQFFSLSLSLSLSLPRAQNHPPVFFFTAERLLEPSLPPWSTTGAGSGLEMI
ncbi:MAG: hypothetical protein J8272_00510, partial ['Prunus persica' phytoplasma PP2]|nr:hypothetical protein ['Prunus persica' phytoplasma PP2]